jgi:hypothetical protein
MRIWSGNDARRTSNKRIQLTARSARLIGSAWAAADAQMRSTKPTEGERVDSEDEVTPAHPEVGYHYTFREHIPDIIEFGLRSGCSIGTELVGGAEAKVKYALPGRVRDAVVAVDLAGVRKSGVRLSGPTSHPDPEFRARDAQMSAREFDLAVAHGESFESFWARMDSETDLWKDPFRAITAVERLHASSTRAQRASIEATLLDWLGSADLRRRYDAIVLVRRLHLRAAIQRLQGLESDDTSSTPNWTRLRVLLEGS